MEKSFPNNIMTLILFLFIYFLLGILTTVLTIYINAKLKIITKKGYTYRSDPTDAFFALFFGPMLLWPMYWIGGVIFFIILLTYYIITKFKLKQYIPEE